jgi:iron complex transport system substrate-binding protein
MCTGTDVQVSSYDPVLSSDQDCWLDYPCSCSLSSSSRLALSLLIFLAILVLPADVQSQPSAPPRIVALNLDALEALRILQAQNMVVGINDGVQEHPDFWGDLADLPVVGSWREPNYELLYSLKPDLLITYSKWPGPELERKLSPLHTKVLRLDLYRIHTFAQDLTILARELGHEEQARKFLTWHNRQLGKVQSVVDTGESRSLVYLESYTDFHALGPGSGGYEMGVLAGGDNVGIDLQIAYPEISPEWVSRHNPEVIIKHVPCSGLDANAAKHLRTFRRAISQRPGWGHIRAVSSGRVFTLSSDICAGPRAIVGIMYMARWFYPEQSTKLHPRAVHREYLKKFHDQDFHGVFAWPYSPRKDS